MTTLYHFSKFVTHATRARTSCACRRQLSSESTNQRTPHQYTVLEMNQQLEPYTRSLTLIGGGLLLVVGSVVYVASLHRQIAVNKTEAEKKIDVNKMEAEKKIVEAEKKIAERFLMYGYAEEFARYQKQAGIHRGAEE